MRIAVTGATGQLGRLVIKSLKTKVSADTIVAFVRNLEKAADLGVETRIFDYNSPDVNSFEGIDKLLLISGNEIGQRALQHANVIASAKRAGVKTVVYTSLLHAETSTLSLAPEHLETEKLLKDSGLFYTILRNGWYTENYAGSAKRAIASGAFIGSAGNGKISSATRADFAEAAAIVLTTNGHENKTYELAGDESYTLADLAAEISKQAGKTIPYNNLPQTEYVKILVSSGLPESLAVAIAGWDVSASKNDLFDDSHQLSKLINRDTTPLAEVVASAIK